MKVIFTTTFLLLLTGGGADQSDTEKPLAAPNKFESAESVEPNINLNSDPNSGGGTQLFHGYPCTADCSGHTAGYEWAEEKDIEDVDDCTGNSQSFIEGCAAYVEEKTEVNTEDSE